MPSDSTPLLAHHQHHHVPFRGSSHPITQRACHSPWHPIHQKLLFFVRAVLTAYLTAVGGVALKYKLESQDSHTNWRIPFQFSTVSFVLQWAYHLVTAIWTGMHAFEPSVSEPYEDSSGSSLRARIAGFFSPPQELSSFGHHAFSVFYTTSHVFPLLHTLLYWTVSVPAGHGGFALPSLPQLGDPLNNVTTMAYDPSKGLFDEDGIKPFIILNLSTLSSVIAFIEMAFLNSIRRPTPVTGHVLSTLAASGSYIAWAGLGKLLTDHWGLFFLDPKLVGDSVWAAAASGTGFVVSAPVVLTYVYGLIGMRESLTASH